VPLVFRGLFRSGSKPRSQCPTHAPGNIHRKSGASHNQAYFLGSCQRRTKLLNLVNNM
jgi:hypothetical protein